MNILISVNEKYLDKAETMLFSLKRNTKEPIAVYLLNRSLPQDHIFRFEQYLERVGIAALYVINVDSAFFDAFPLEIQFSIETYYRILAQFLLPETLDRVLWLDADIIILRDIGEFYHQSFDGMKYVVCPDKNEDSWELRIQKERLGIPDTHIYFNAGVMLMDLELLRQETKREMIMQKCLELKDKLLYLDQDILNTLYSGQVKYAEQKIYNYQLSDIRKLPKEDADQVSILHYTGHKKPWDYHYMNNASKYYWKARYAQGHRVETVKSYGIVGQTESGVPVVCSMGDNQASFMGSVDDPENTLLLNIGTGSQISFMTKEYVDVNSDIELRPYGENYLLAGSALCGGRAYAMLEEFYREISGHSCYDIMSKYAEDFLNSHDISQAWDVDTRFNGTRSNPNITGSIRGITAENFCPGAFTVGVMRGIIASRNV